jgi:hypothetical protein
MEAEVIGREREHGGRRPENDRWRPPQSGHR